MLAKQAAGSRLWFSMVKRFVLVAAASRAIRVQGWTFFPLMCDYRERTGCGR